MAIRKRRPTSPGRRFQTSPDFSEITTDRPERSLVVKQSSTGGRNNYVVTALPNGTIGVMWSNQTTGLFGFRVHADGADPDDWSEDEVPASESAIDDGAGMADDHIEDCWIRA